MRAALCDWRRHFDKELLSDTMLCDTMILFVTKLLRVKTLVLQLFWFRLEFGGKPPPLLDLSPIRQWRALIQVNKLNANNITSNGFIVQFSLALCVRCHLHQKLTMPEGC